jgi:4-aminobutyrate aminotransferase/(S)-3-amino-2-methylpropionate transaminase
MVAVELVGPDGITPDKTATARVAAACHAQGVLVLSAGTYGNVLRLLPPLVIPDDLLDEGLGIIEAALAQA